jgi:hypothetical protein
MDLGGASSDVEGEPTETALPRAPKLTNVVPAVRGDSVGIDFDPVDDAVDYRVYPLPGDADVTTDMDGSVVVRNAIYRCAGHRQTFDLQNSLNANDTSLLRTRAEFSWNAKVPDQPTLGYVRHGRRRANARYGGWARTTKPASKRAVPRSTTDSVERERLLAQNYRDDGVAFYVRAPRRRKPISARGPWSTATRTSTTSTPRNSPRA